MNADDGTMIGGPVTPALCCRPTFSLVRRFHSMPWRRKHTQWHRHTQALRRSITWTSYSKWYTAAWSECERAASFSGIEWKWRPDIWWHLSLRRKIHFRAINVVSFTLFLLQGAAITNTSRLIIGVGPPFRRVRHFQPFPAVTTRLWIRLGLGLGQVRVSHLVVAISRTIPCNDHEWRLSEWQTFGMADRNRLITAWTSNFQKHFDAAMVVITWSEAAITDYSLSLFNVYYLLGRHVTVATRQKFSSISLSAVKLLF